MLVKKPLHLWTKQLVSLWIFPFSSEHLLQCIRVRHYHHGTNSCIGMPELRMKVTCMHCIVTGL